jgi:hypothetical protein
MRREVQAWLDAVCAAREEEKKKEGMINRLTLE